MTRSTHAGDDLARDEILFLPVGAIAPDPDQPRLEVDDALAASIAQHGVLQAIEVRPHPSGADDRWMITDGERRWRGATKARQATIPATLRLDVEEPADRIVRQLVRNEGKPLTPAEEALAFQRIIAGRRAAGQKKYGVAQLATELGLAKSTVSDRLTLTEIPAFWLKLIVDGPLQLSHAPLLHKWRKVPEKFQRRALEQMQGDYRWAGGDSYSKAKKGERLYVSVLETLLETFMRKFIKPVRDVPGYVGPTDVFQGREYNAGRLVHATDPSLWQPIYRKALAAKKKKASVSGRSRASSTSAKSDAASTERQSRYAAEQRRAEEDRKTFAAARPKVFTAFADVVNRGPVTRNSAIGQMVVKQVTGSGVNPKKVAEWVSPGTTAEQLLRYCAMLIVARGIGDTWSGHQQALDFAKVFGVDLKALLGGDEPSAPAKAKRARKTKVSAPLADATSTDDSLVDDATGEVACKYCGCTESHACEADAGPCSWYDPAVPVCSNPSCVSSYEEDVESAAADAERNDGVDSLEHAKA